MAPAKKKTATKIEASVTISAPNMVQLDFKITGTAPYVSNKFTRDAFESMRDGMTQTPEEKKKAKAKQKERPARDFDRNFEQSQRKSSEGWHGIPATAFRRAMVDACRMTGIKMTNAKMSVFVLAEGYDMDDGEPLVRIHGEMSRLEKVGVNANGSTDIRVRPIWHEWTANLSVTFDADQFSSDDVANLLERAGRQVGIGAGRPFSVKGTGCGWGTFTTGTQDDK